MSMVRLVALTWTWIQSLLEGSFEYAYKNPPRDAMTTNMIPFSVIFASNIRKPNTVMGTLFREPVDSHERRGRRKKD
jgi:hypothetical protein